MHIVEAVPTDQPFVTYARFDVRHRRVGVATAAALAGAAAVVVVTAALRSPVAPILAVLFCPPVILVGVVGFHLWRRADGSALLAAGPYGLWIRHHEQPTTTGLGRASGDPIVYLPWAEVERVSIVHWRLLDRRLVVSPRGGSVGRGLVHALYGDGYRVQIMVADRPTVDILRALAHYSAGRCAIG